jgi:hypothetical protein
MRRVEVFNNNFDALPLVLALKKGMRSIYSHRQSLLKGVSALNPDSETLKIPTRNDMIKRMKQENEEFDLLIIGGGATGSGAALEAASRGMKVCCVEREDFASGTSSRSTKLLWGGSRYLVQAFVSLLSKNLITSPVQTVQKFYHEFRMVMHCHKERNFMLKNQPHLTWWVPIAVPLKHWVIWPAPFNFYPAALGPMGLFPAFFKFVRFSSNDAVSVMFSLLFFFLFGSFSSRFIVPIV